MDPVQQVMDATFASRDTARRLLSENGNDVKAAIRAFRHPQGRVAGFGDLRGSTPKGSDRVFTGGEKSGLAVQNRGERGHGRGIVGDIIEKAMHQTSSNEEPEDDPFSSATGFRLGQSGDNYAQAVPAAARQPQLVTRTLTFWANGFSIDDGPLHGFDDPMTQTYLDRINSGNAPLDLMNIEANQSVDLRLEDRHGEEYKVKPKPVSLSNMSGGQRLGEDAGEASAPVVSSSASSTAPSTALPSSYTAPAGSGDALVQLRLADGSSRRVRVEADGPVQQLYDLVGPSDRQYVLQTPMPPKVIDTTKTVRENGCVNAVVVQRWI